MHKHCCIALTLLLSFSLGASAETSDFFTASSIHPPQRNETYEPALAFDGDPNTRWASAQKGKHWLQVDFGQTIRINEIRIHWEHAYAIEYKILTSLDGKQWEEAYHETDGKDGKKAIRQLNARGRYLRIQAQKTALGLASIWDVTFSDKMAVKALAMQRKKLAELKLQQALQDDRHKAETLARLGMEEVVYATRPMHPDGHWYANIAYYSTDENRVTYRKGGGLYKYNLKTDTVIPLIEDEEGTIRDPAVHYDGHTIIFSWRKGGTKHFHLYTIDADSTGLKQLTDGEYDDFEPAWLPDGGITFVSTRCRRWVQCWLTQVAVVHRMNADGTNVRPLSANLEHDNTPWPMPDGRILFMRWEYVDRSQVDYHHLWTMNPDGTGQMVYFGNMHPGGVFIDAKPVPDSDEIVMVHSPGHGQKEHMGRIALVHVKNGPDDLDSIDFLTGMGYRDPYALSKDQFIAAKGNALVLFDRNGHEYDLHAIDGRETGRQLHEPRPLAPRPREHVIPNRVDYAESTGRVVLADAHVGRNMDGVNKGDITQLLVIESLPKPINFTGGMDPLSYGGTFTLERILGTVPVEDDGSAYVEIPANRAVFFVAQDKDGMSVKRMQSFMSVMPGETMSCVGCHEQRTMTGQNPARQKLKALNRAPSTIQPIANIPEVFDYPRDIQPILDKHCLKCHDYTKHEGVDHGPRSGGVILSGDHGPMFSHSYAQLTINHQIADGRDQAVSNYAPRTLGAVASPVMHKIVKGHHGVKLTQREMDYVRYWLESGATYPGTYGALGCGSIGGYHENRLIETDADWAETKPAIKAVRDRCISCHKRDTRLPQNLSDENGHSFWRPNWNDPRLKWNRHLFFNLSNPEHSLYLMAPLAKAAGGLELCGEAVFASKEDPDYQRILALITAGKIRLQEIKRFDMPRFQPPAQYVREMQRFNVLPEDLPADAPVDPYACDQAYWRSFNQDIAQEHEAYQMAQGK